MEKAEIERINTFLNDVQEAICEQDPPHVLQLQLNEQTISDYMLQGNRKLIYKSQMAVFDNAMSMGILSGVRYESATFI